MRITYYSFPENTPEDILLQNGCYVYLKNGAYFSTDHILDEHRNEVDYIDTRINCSVSTAKKLLKQFGGSAYTQHIDRDGSCFEVSEITLKGNNSKFKYNHHL